MVKVKMQALIDRIATERDMLQTKIACIEATIAGYYDKHRAAKDEAGSAHVALGDITFILGPECSICRSRHGREIVHPCE